MDDLHSDTALDLLDAAPDSTTLARLAALQRELARRVRVDSQDATVLGLDGLDALRTVAGVDVSYNRGSERFFAAAVMLELPSLAVVAQASAELRVRFPYIPGYLSFREAPVMLEALRRLPQVPDVVLVDGHGVAHPRRLGIASHVGLLLGCPSVGCAKKRLRGHCDEPGPEPGESSALRLGDEVVGAALRTRRRARPMFISPGHLIDREAALELVRRCGAGYRLPEPTRLAHEAVNRVRRGADAT